MALTASLEMTPNGVAKITVAGDLDASTAPILRTAIDNAAAQSAKRLVLLVSDLDFMASAGLRVLIFAKQKMGANVDLYVVAAKPPILETITMTGFQHSVTLVDSYDASVIEKF